jgi:ABC-type uncharacterized transport system involved in gliding motility auxiliary subunit
MKRHQTVHLLQSGLGVVALLALLIAVNFLAGLAKQRIDLTEDKEHTLSQGTLDILGELDTPVQVRLYASVGNPSMPVVLRNHAERIEELLSEYAQASGGMVEVEKLDPVPDSAAEDSARLDGIQGEPLPDGGRIYLGASVTMLDRKEVLPFLVPARDSLLEYDITRAIDRVSSLERPVVGLMTPLDLAGIGGAMMRGPGGAPWILHTELSGDYEVRQVPMDAKEIPSEVKVLLVVHPRGIGEQPQYAIDQFLMRGGKMVAFLDPASPFPEQNPMMTPGAMTGSTFDKLLPAWGIDFDTSKVVADLTYNAATRQGREPAFLALTEDALDQDDVVSADAGSMVVILGGAFTGEPVEGLAMSVLARSSTESELVDPAMARLGGAELAKNFKPSGVPYDLAIRLTGIFTSAFPGGAPDGDGGGDEGLKESAVETSVILFGDSDMLRDQIAIREFPGPFGQRLVMPANGNIPLALAAVENLTGDTGLMTIRARAEGGRPFTLVRDMRVRAEAKYRDKIRQLESSLAETERRLGELQSVKEGSQRFILSPEQQKELEDFRKREAEVRQELKTVRRDLRKEIDSLENTVKWVNIAAVPLLVGIFGTGLAIWRARRGAAR